MSKHNEITTILRQQLLHGKFQPGTLLPTTQQLADQFATSVYTVHTAVAPLVSEGLVERRRNLGTVVRHNASIFTCAGIYCSIGLLDEWEYVFYRELTRQIQRQLEEDGVRTLLITDTRPPDERSEPLPELVEAVENRRIQGLFVPLVDLFNLPWLRQLPVTTTYVSSEQSVNPVSFDNTQMLQLALTKLQQSGCRRIGMISAVQAPKDEKDTHFGFYETFSATVSDLALETRDSWVVTPTEYESDHEHFGYHAMHQLWQQDDRPDGLFIYPDTSGRGSVMAMLELGIRLPDDLQVVCHRNTGIDWICPLSIHWILSDVAQCAKEMIGQIRRQKAGSPISPIKIPCSIHQPETQ